MHPKFCATSAVWKRTTRLVQSSANFTDLNPVIGTRKKRSPRRVENDDSVFAVIFFSHFVSSLCENLLEEEVSETNGVVEMVEKNSGKGEGRADHYFN